MQTDTTPRKKPYAPPTITRHGGVVQKTLGHRLFNGEMWSPGGPPDQH
jgi:hypothetical protein